MHHTFVLATHNQHKIEEFDAILSALVPGIQVIGYDGPEPVEDGVSFDENALIKARAAAAHTGLPSLADDSGICVDVLGGAPGIFSARWAGSAKDNAANVQLLLDQLSDVRDGDRGAYFTCHIAVVIPATADAPAEEFVIAGNWPGTIASEVRGANGFGYDPIFIPEGHSVSAAELDPAQKNDLSHRSRALRALAEVLSARG
jgi:XTP/dITP diphosphohydrolase